MTRRKGVGSITAVATGRAAHAGNLHHQGVNAIWALARFIDAAQKLTDYAKGTTVNVGQVVGGDARNTVPDSARAELDPSVYVTRRSRATLGAAHGRSRDVGSERPGGRARASWWNLAPSTRVVA